MKLNRFEKFLLVLAIWVVFSWLTSKEAFGQDTTRVMVLRVAGYPIEGQVLCRGTNVMPIIIVKAELPDSEAQAVVLHEMVHIHQMMNRGGCLRASLEYESNPEFRFQQEAEAYCAQLRWWLQRPNTKVDYNKSLLNLGYALWRVHGMISQEAAVARFKAICPKED